MIVFETDRLELREHLREDLDELFLIMSDAETMQYYPRPYTRAETAEGIERCLKSYREKGFGLWALILKPERRFIGQCGILMIDIDGHLVPEIGYRINKAYWNQGLATEAAWGCLKFGFGHLALDEIYIHTYVKNIPSRRVAEKVGMTERKEYDKQVDPSGRVMRHVVFSMQKSELDK